MPLRPPERGTLRTYVHHGTSLPRRSAPSARTPRSCLGPVADLEAHLPAEWWRKLFNALYVKTDGDVVENVENTRREVDFIVSAAAVQSHSQILDLCCGQGRHCLELARRGFKNVTGVDRSRYLVRLAKKRAQTEGLQVVFKEGDARNPRLPENSFDCVAIMGNSFGYFSNKQDDEKVLTAVGKILRPSGQLVLDITDGAFMADHFERRSWEWIDEHHFVCRERSLSRGRERLISREVIVHDEIGRHRRPVLRRTPVHPRKHPEAAGEDRLPQYPPPRQRRIPVRSRPGPRHDGAPPAAHGRCPAASRAQAQGQGAAYRRHGGDGRPAPARRGQARRRVQPRGPRHHPQACRMRCRSCPLTSSAISTTTARSSATSPTCAPTSCSTCATRGSTTIPSRSCTCRRMLEVLGIPYTGAGPVRARRLLRQGARARRRHVARCAGAARDATCARAIRARRLPSRVPGASEAQLRRQLARHHQGRGRQEREGAARLPRALAQPSSPSGRSSCRNT